MVVSLRQPSSAASGLEAVTQLPFGRHIRKDGLEPSPPGRHDAPSLSAATGLSDRRPHLRASPQSTTSSTSGRALRQSARWRHAFIRPHEHDPMRTRQGQFSAAIALRLSNAENAPKCPPAARRPPPAARERDRPAAEKRYRGLRCTIRSDAARGGVQVPRDAPPLTAMPCVSGGTVPPRAEATAFSKAQARLGQPGGSHRPFGRDTGSYAGLHSLPLIEAAVAVLGVDNRFLL